MSDTDKEQIEALLKEISPLNLVRDGTIVSNQTEIDIRSDDYEHWITIKSDNDKIAERLSEFIAAAPEIISSLLEQIKEKDRDMYEAEKLIRTMEEQIKLQGKVDGRLSKM